MYIGRAPRHGQAMTGQPNQDRRRKKSPDPTHLHSVDGSFASHRPPETFPLNPERPTTPTVQAAKSCRPKQKTA